MKQIMVNVNDAEGLLEYISELIEAIDVENEEICNFIDEGYTNFVQPLVDLVEAAKKEPNENGSKWAEILNDFADLEEGKSYIDAWLTDNPNEAFVEIAEGKFHQVKRMFERVGKTVTYLKRVSIGGLALPDELNLGDVREMTLEEMEKAIYSK